MQVAARSTQDRRCGIRQRHRRARLHAVAVFSAIWCVALVALSFVPRRGDGAPYPAQINADQVRLRSGPGDGHHATELLRRGDAVQVDARDANGWCRIHPSPESFSWIPAEAVEVQGDGTARVVRDRATVAVGSQFDERRDVVQVVLERDAIVELLPGQTKPSRGANGAWYKIAPPAGEYRWIHQQYLRPGAPPAATARRKVDQPVALAKRATSRVEQANYETPVGEQRRLMSVRPTSPASGEAARDNRTAARMLDELETDFAAIVSKKSGTRQLAEIEADAHEAARRAGTNSEHERASLILRRIERLRARQASDGSQRGVSHADYPESVESDVGRERYSLVRKAGGGGLALVDDEGETRYVVTPAGGGSSIADPAAELATTYTPPPPSGLMALAQYLAPGVAGTVAPPYGGYGTVPPQCGTPPLPPVVNPNAIPYVAFPPRHFVAADALGWWVKGDNVPPLVTTSPIGTLQAQAGVLGQPNTSILFGNTRVNDDIRPGGRIQGGIWVDDYQTFAVEGNYLALVTETATFSRTSTFSNGSLADPILARPFFNIAPAVNQQSSLLVAFPNLVIGPGPLLVHLDGSVLVQESSQVQSAGGGGRLALGAYDAPAHFFLLGGYRWFELDETLTIINASTPGIAPFPQTRVQSADTFAVDNVFNGGEIGLGTELIASRFSLGVETRLAIGNMYERLVIDGRTSAIHDGFVASYTGGLLAQPTNIGTYSRNRLALIPQADIKLGFQLFPALRLTVGYNFTYITKVLRPGDQVDLTVNTTQIAGLPLVGPARPQTPFEDTSIWLQGVTAGLDLRF